VSRRIVLTAKEVHRLKIVSCCLKGEITTIKATEALDRSLRQTYRIKSAVRVKGVNGVIHGLKGKPSNNRKLLRG